jgi:hypothetical protein
MLHGVSHIGPISMTITTSRPLGAYITERELPRTADGRVFELLLPYQVESLEKATVFRWRWMYTDTQRAVDARCGIPTRPIDWGIRQMTIRTAKPFADYVHERELPCTGAAFERHVLSEPATVSRFTVRTDALVHCASHVSARRFAPSKSAASPSEQYCCLSSCPRKGAIQVSGPRGKPK